jgi:hypothetical protein
VHRGEIIFFPNLDDSNLKNPKREIFYSTGFQVQCYNSSTSAAFLFHDLNLYICIFSYKQDARNETRSFSTANIEKHFCSYLWFGQPSLQWSNLCAISSSRCSIERPSLYGVVRQRIIVTHSGCFGTTFRDNVKVSSNLTLTYCSVRN